MNFNALETSRLILKNIDQFDRDFVYKQFSDDAINTYLFDAEPVTCIEEADEIVNYYTYDGDRMHHRYVLVLKETQEPIGTCGFHAWDALQKSMDIGYDLQEAYWHQGYMQEALTEMLNYMKTHLDLNRINACIYKDNTASIKLVEKFGFVKTGTKYEHFRGQDYLHYVYSLKL